MRTNRQLKLIHALVAPVVAAFAVSVTAQHPFVRVLDTGDWGHYAANAGASWGDYDGDGDLDIYAPSTNPSLSLNSVYRNDGGGVFTRMNESDVGDLALDDGSARLGIWADMDNDGDLDLYVANESQSDTNPSYGDLIYLNDGTGRFDRHAPVAFSQPMRPSTGASLFDYDQDGLLDVLVATWPEGADVLYHNEGALRFSEALSITPATLGLFSFWGDVDEDGDYDIIVGDFDWTTPSFFYLNQAAEQNPGEFVYSASFSNGTTLPNRLSDADWGDFDNDGDLDLIAGHSSHTGYDLFRNDGHGNYTQIDIPLQGDLRSGTVVWVDVDNDGWLDLLAETWDTDKDYYELGYTYLRNQGDGGFYEWPIVSDVDFQGELHLPNPGDYDNDGDLDFIFVVSSAGPGVPEQLWRNEGNDNHWLKLVLRGTVSNASAIGAIVRVKATIEGQETWQMRQVFAGGKYLAQTDPRPNFGLGEASVAEVVRIEWPSGIVQELADVPANQTLTVVEPVRLNVNAPDRLSWHSSRARVYTLESASTVNGPWAPATEAVEADGNLRTATIDASEGNRFYRIQNTPPAPIPPNPNLDTLVWMTPGTFLMGSPATEPEREALVPTTGYGDETQHQVTLTHGFWMAKYETTQKEYTAIMGSNPSAFTGERQPVESVTWHESVAYCEKLTVQEQAAGRLPEGYVYRLPTEAEWEYACRAGTTTAFALGEELRSRQANFDGTREYSVADGGTVSNAGGYSAGRPIPVGVSMFPPNAWGLHDMHGNVREWCADRIEHYPTGPVTDPTTPRPTDDWGPVQRGGHWGAPGAYCRSAHRDFHFPDFRNSHYGFRVVLARPID